MSTFAYSHVTGADWNVACTAIAAALAAQSAQGDLAFVYADHRFAGDADRIIDRLRSATGIAHWIGTVGMGICSTGLEVYDEPSIAVMRTDLPAEAFRVLTPMVESVDEVMDALASWLDVHPATLAVVHGDPGNGRVPGLIEALADRLPGGFLVGGLTSSEAMQVQFADRAVGGGLSGVLIDAGGRIATGLSQGCSLIGEKRRITDCRQNVIATLDGRPALDVLKEDIGEVLARDLRRIGGYIFAALPVSGSDTGDYLVRNLIGIDPDQGLVAIGDMVTEDSYLQFAKRDAQTARADLERMLDGIGRRLNGPPKGALYHTCLGRGRHLFGEQSEELRVIREHLGDIPLVGFYANGEISHRRLYGYTGVLTVFS
jgi:small ligand-binding sensory domain FIST